VWPDSYTADVNVNIFRGGYLIRHVEAFKPETTT
jgi:hypothetical protein